MPFIPNYLKTRNTHGRSARADQPAATDVITGTIHYVTDEYVTERSNGTSWEQWGSFYLDGITHSSTTTNAASLPTFLTTDAGIHIRLEDRGLVGDDHLAPSQYVLLAESEDAIIGLISENEGGHGSGIDLMEIDGGTLADKWFIGRLSSGTSNSEFVLYYGTDQDYGLNTRMLTLTTGRILALGSLSSSNPAIKPNGTELQVRLADDSAPTALASGLHTIQRGGSSPTFGTWVTTGNPPLVTFGETDSGNSDHVFACAANGDTVRPVFLLRRSRGTLASPTACQNGSILGSFLASGRSSNNDWQNTAAVEFAVHGTVSGSNVPTGITFVTGQTGAGRTTKLAITYDGIIKFGSITATNTIPALKASSTELQVRLGDDSAYTSLAASYLAVADGISAPGAGTGVARIYVDTSDGDLKVVFADGTVKTIVTDT